LTFYAHAFKLILHVSSQVAESYSEKVCKQGTSQFEAFILEMVFIVGFAFAQL
jgi:hypothetical protein